MSETGTARPYLARFCVGRGADIGFGGDPILPDSITVDKNVATSPTICCDAAELPFKDGQLDYLFSSHCLEDFDDTSAVLKEWLRVIKHGGNLVLFLPDQLTYLKHCQENNVKPNEDHKHLHFGPHWVEQALGWAGYNKIIHWEWPCTYNPYSFALVTKRM